MVDLLNHDCGLPEARSEYSGKVRDHRAWTIRSDVLAQVNASSDLKVPELLKVQPIACAWLRQELLINDTSITEDKTISRNISQDNTLPRACASNKEATTFYAHCSSLTNAGVRIPIALTHMQLAKVMIGFSFIYTSVHHKKNGLCLVRDH